MIALLVKSMAALTWIPEACKDMEIRVRRPKKIKITLQGN